jgi:amino acid transporter
MVAQSAVSRILFAMARDGNLPAVLAKVHPRFRTPYISTILVSMVSLAVGLIFAARLDDLSRIVNFGALSGFLLLHLSVVNHFLRRERSRDWLRYLLCPLLGFLVIAYVLYEMDATAKIFGGCWIVVGLIYYLTLRFVFKRKLQLAA